VPPLKGWKLPRKTRWPLLLNAGRRGCGRGPPAGPASPTTATGAIPPAMPRSSAWPERPAPRILARKATPPLASTAGTPGERFDLMPSAKPWSSTATGTTPLGSRRNTALPVAVVVPSWAWKAMRVPAAEGRGTCSSAGPRASGLPATSSSRVGAPVRGEQAVLDDARGAEGVDGIRVLYRGAEDDGAACVDDGRIRGRPCGTTPRRAPGRELLPLHGDGTDAGGPVATKTPRAHRSAGRRRRRPPDAPRLGSPGRSTKRGSGEPSSGAGVADANHGLEIGPARAEDADAAAAAGHEALEDHRPRVVQARRENEARRRSRGPGGVADADGHGRARGWQVDERLAGLGAGDPGREGDTAGGIHRQRRGGGEEGAATGADDGVEPPRITTGTGSVAVGATRRMTPAVPPFSSAWKTTVPSAAIAGRCRLRPELAASEKPVTRPRPATAWPGHPRSVVVPARRTNTPEPRSSLPAAVEETSISGPAVNARSPASFIASSSPSSSTGLRDRQRVVGEAPR